MTAVGPSDNLKSFHAAWNDWSRKATHLAEIVCTFLTHRHGRPLTFGVVVDDRRKDLGLSPDCFAHLAALANRNPGACAYGKIVTIGRQGIFTFQATASGAAAAAFCGNSTAAAISFMAAGGPLSTLVHGGSARPYAVTARVEGETVSQSWTVPTDAVEERIWRGRRILLLPTLNDYAIVLDRLPDNVTPEAARRELLGPAPTSKLALIGDRAGVPVVEFHNSNGRHGAIPQTGLATMALAVRSVGWLGDRFPDGHLTYLAGRRPVRIALPRISDTICGRLAIEMPVTAVRLDTSAMEMVA